jgi:undecaprenyl diphosphate synthase
LENDQHIDYKAGIDPVKLPQHIAIIMDGNGRWAKAHGKHRVFGHKNGVRAVREAAESCAEIGVKYLTLYAFSTENWNRPKTEVAALMDLLLLTIGKEIKTLQKNKIRLNAIGNLEMLPESNKKALNRAIEETKDNDRMVLTLALSYGSRDEIISMTRKLAEAYKQGKISLEDIDELAVSKNLYTGNIPDPEILIRTSGEHRISNFLLWQIAYAEFFFLEKFWPDFDRNDIYRILYDYQHRERRFGMTTEQIIQSTAPINQ